MQSTYLIVANGPFLAKAIIEEAAGHAQYIVALDAAADKLAYLGIKPDIIMGDFDSIQAALDWDGLIHPEDQPATYFAMPYLRKDGITVISSRDQNFTDLQKAIKFIKQDGTPYGFEPAEKIDIVCATGGGRIDLELANYHTLCSEYDEKCPIYMHNEYQTAFFVTNQTVTIHGKIGDHCGLFGMPYASMRILNEGLAYGGSADYELNSHQYSVSNHLIKNEAEIAIKGHALLIHPPMLRAQRDFAQKNRHEQLRILRSESRIC